MMYCTKCGSSLKGSTKSCPACGYEVSKMRTDLSTPRQVRRSVEESKGWAPPIPDQRKEKEQTKNKPFAREPIKWGMEEDEPRQGIEDFRSPFEDFGRRPGKTTLSDEAGADEEEPDDPRYVTGCSVCGGRPVNRCFFTKAPLCNRHTVKMQIFVRTQPFGEVVSASPHMALRKEGKNPLPSEAQEAGMFFSIKPYHEWKRVG